MEVDTDEELALKLGYADHMESEFWDVDDEHDDRFDDDEEGLEDQGQGDFWANVAALQALEKGSQ